jgi:integrase
MSVERRGKRWRVRWREGNQGHSRTFDRKHDAVQFEAEIRRRRQLGTLASLVSGRETLDEFFRESWEPRAKPRLADRTWRDYQYYYRELVGPHLGGLYLDQLNVESLSRWQADMLATHGAGTVRHTYQFLAALLEDAFKTERIPRNPMRLIDIPRVQHRDRPPTPSPLVTEKLRVAAREMAPNAALAIRNPLLISLMGYAGLRPEEARGLLWGDIRSRTLFIQRALVRGGYADTKTHARRSVKLLDALFDDLEKARRQLPGTPDLSDPILQGRKGEALSENAYETWTSRNFHQYRDRIGAPGIVPYDLRHAFASLLLHEGRSVIYVAKQLGHDPQMTLSIYGHVIEELEDQPRLSANDAIKQARADIEMYELPDADDESD